MCYVSDLVIPRWSANPQSPMLESRCTPPSLWCYAIMLLGSRSRSFFFSDFQLSLCGLMRPHETTKESNFVIDQIIRDSIMPCRAVAGYRPARRRPRAPKS